MTDIFIHSPDITYTMLAVTECLFSHTILTKIYGKGINVTISEIGKYVESSSLFQVH